MAEAAIWSAIQELYSLPGDSKVEELKNDLKLMLDFLRGSGLSRKKFKEDSRLCYLVSDVVEMAHDTHLLHNQIFGNLDREVIFIRDCLQETKDRILKFIFEAAWVPQSQINVGEEYSGVVGLEEDVELLLREAIFGTISDSSALCIVGMTGIGKTTLARELYNHPAVVDGFECRAWVHVSSELSRKELLMQLIRQVLDSKKLEIRDVLMEKMECADNTILREMLHYHLQGISYLIVLDSMEKEKLYYKPVFQALCGGERGSRLMLTSRTDDVTSFLPEHCYIHKMKFLDRDRSWHLFLKTLCSGSASDRKFPAHLEKPGREMLTKYCSGLPLAIKEVGRQLAEKRQSGSEWEELLESTNWIATLSTLEYIYLNLSPKVKPCFLHLGFFKEGTAIRAERLKHILIAERVVSQKVIYEAYLYSLVGESILEVKERAKDSRIKSFRVNALFHRLSIAKAKEEICFEILRNDGTIQPSQEPRRLAIYCSREKFNHSTNQDKHIVSLFFHGGGYFDTSPSYWKHFQLLKILDLEGFGLKFLPETVGTLTKLRYLGVRDNCIQELPRSLVCLKNLEVLDIALNFMVEVTDLLLEMDSLCHLYMSDIICQNPLKIHTLKNLKTLTYISIDNWRYDQWGLKMMTSLRRLGIEGLDGNSDVSKLFTSLAQLRNLDCLILRGFRYRSMPLLDELGILYGLTQLKLDGVLTRLPSANNFPPNICFLTLVNTCLDEDPMPVLERLSKLYYLKLWNAYTGREMEISGHGFPSLVVLCIGELWHLRNVRVAENRMQSLLELEIVSCPYMETIPEVMINNLEELKMITTKCIATKIRESVISKIRHVNIQP